MSVYVPLSAALPEQFWPADLFGDDVTFLDKLACLIYDERGTADDPLSDTSDLLDVFIQAKVLAEARIPMPFLQGVELVLGEGDSDETGLIELELTSTLHPEDPPDIVLRIRTTVLSISFAREILRPVDVQETDGRIEVVDRPGRVAIPLPFEVEIRHQGGNWSFEIDVPAGEETSLRLPTAMIGETGVVVSAEGIVMNLSGAGSTRPTGAPAGWKGLYLAEVSLWVPSLFSGRIEASGMGIGTGGFYGELAATFPLAWDSTTGEFSGPLATEVFGMPAGISSVVLGFVQNVPTAFSVGVKILLPFFDAPVDLDVGLNLHGGITVGLSSESGLAELAIDDVLTMQLDGVAFEIGDGLFTAKVSGKLTPLVGGLAWPTFDVKELSIDSQGHVKLAGGWLDLPSQYSLDLSGFSVEITKLGFGKTDDGGKWIGFSGALHLVEGLSAGASVEGLRVTWYPNGDTRLTLEGAGVEFEVPDVLRFKGSVSLREFEDEDGATVRRFDGDISLELVSLGLTVDGTLVIGTAKPQNGPRYRFFAIYLDVQLPVGIPIGSTGVSIYGVAGLFANNMEPGRDANQPWYSLGTADWYHETPVGVTDLGKKWENERGSLGLGAGVCIGTGSDNGFTFAGKVLLLIIFPGPTIMLEGSANLMKERAKLSDDALFRSLAVIDCRAKSFLIGLDAQYKTGDGGELIDLKVGAEAFFDFDDPLAWHIWLGQKEPRERRIRATIFRIFQANSYLMIDAHKLQTGAWVGFGKSWSFGPVGLTMEAWIEGNAVLSWKPAHFHGDLWLHGSLKIRVFRFRLGLTVDARISADVFEPFHVRAEVSASIDLPRPFKSRKVNAVIEWGPKPGIPPVPLPLQEVAMEHLLATTTWPLGRKAIPATSTTTTTGTTTTPAVPALIVPDYNDPLRNGYVNANLTTNPAVVNSPPPADAPVVPVDARARLTFARPVNDDALVGVNVQPVVPEREVIGDPTSSSKPYTARFGLKSLVLSTWTGSAWTPVASAPQSGSLRSLYGSWAPVPALPDGDGPNFGQVKLWLWSKTPFDYTRHTSRDWDEWFTKKYTGGAPGTGYPCIPPAPDRAAFCCDFETSRVGEVRGALWTWTDHEELALAWPAGVVAQVTTIAPPVEGFTHALCLAPGPVTRPGEPGRTGDAANTGNVGAPANPGGQALPGDAAKPGQPVPAAPPGGAVPATPGAASSAVAGQPVAEGAVVVPARGGEVLGGAAVVSPGIEVRLPQAARRVRVLLAWPPGPPARQCADLRPERPAKGPNPRPHGGAVFAARGASPQPTSTTIVAVPTSTGPLSGLATGAMMTVELPRDSDFVEVMMTCFRPGVGVSALDAAGAVVASAPVTGAPRVTTTLRLDAPRIRRVVIQAAAEAFLHQVCFAGAPVAPKIEAHAWDTRGGQSGPYPLTGARIDVQRPDISRVVLRGDKAFCVVQVCVEPGPDPLDVARREEMTKHTRDELARWSQAGDVLEPHTQYRLTVVTTVESKNKGSVQPHVQTEYAYFTTGGPPGIGSYSRPPGVPNETVFATGLEDLTRYVRQTVPATVAGPGEKPPLPRPVYRAYDTGVEFNQDYVELMYRLDRRDLALHLYDNNNQPVRDARGRLVALSNNWGRTEDLSLSQSDDRWITMLNGSGCQLSVDKAVIPHQVTIGATSEGHVLDPDVVYEGRLVPLLVHETWSDEQVGAAAGRQPGPWTVVDLATTGGPSVWVVAAGATAEDHVVRQTSAIAGGNPTGTDPNKPGTLLLLADRGPLTPAAEQPASWTDYRLTVNVRSGGDGALGVVFRYVDDENYYRFAIDRGRRCRQLVRVAGGQATILAEDDEPYRMGFDYVITVAAVGPAIDVQVDGDPLFAVVDGAHTKGRIGLYCWANDAARFADVRVDDFRLSAPVPYRFKFTTSRFVNFFHHLHSFRDEAWTVSRPIAQLSDADVVAAATQSAALNGPLLDAEMRAYAALAAAALGSAADQDPRQVEVTRVERPTGEALALIVRSPEPIDWRRATIDVRLSASAETGVHPVGQDVAKLTDATFAAATGVDQESVSMLLQRATDLTASRIDQRRMDGLPQSRAGTLLFLDDEHRRDPAQPGRVGPWTIQDLGPSGSAPVWRVARNAVACSVLGGASAAVTGPLGSSDVRGIVRLHSDGAGAVGVVFRYVDDANHYRFVLGAAPAFRRLERIQAGVATTLWSDGGALAVSQSVTVAVEAAGRWLRGSVDGIDAFAMEDGALSGDRFGLYCAGTDGVRFEQAEVRHGSLWRDRFRRDDTQGWSLSGPGTWTTSGGALNHAGAATAGATATGGDAAWTDVMVTADLRADTGAVGLLFRHADAANTYRFVLAGPTAGASLVRTVAGVSTVLWSGAPQPSATARVTVVAQGSMLRGFVNRVPVFAVDDPDRAAGGVGVWATGNARIANVRVDSLASTTSSWLLEEEFAASSPGGWQVVDEGLTTGPSTWSFDGGEARQTGAIGDPTKPVGAKRAAPPLARIRAENPDFLGTEAVAGDPAWTDHRLTVRLRSDGQGAIGVLFRFADKDNCYRFSMDPAAPYRRLVKKVGGRLTTLWQDAIAIVTGREYLVTIDCQGGRLTGYLDGVQLFRVTDLSVPAGQVGLYSWANTAARFRDVRVAPPSWSLYYGFGGEEPLPAGTRLQVWAGPEGAVGAPAGAGITARYADRGEVGFDRDEIRLRLVDAGGIAGHERTFLAPAAFAPADLRIIRKADGTAFALLAPASGTAPRRVMPGGYRLTLSYRRNNRTADPASQVFKQAGESSPETVTIDIPWTVRP